MSAWEMLNALGDYAHKRKLPNLFGIYAFLPQGTVVQLSDIPVLVYIKSGIFAVIKSPVNIDILLSLVLF